MQGHEIKSNLVKKNRFSVAAFSLKVICCVVLLQKQTLQESVIRSFEKRQNFRLKAVNHFSQGLMSY